MRIAMLTLAAPPLSGRLQLEAETLAELGHELHVIYVQGELDAQCKPAKLGYRETALGFGGSKLRRGLKLPAIYFELLRQLNRGRFEVVHCGHPMLLLPAIIYKRRRRGKLVYDPFEMYGLVWANYMPIAKRLWRPLLEGLEDRLARQADCILTVDSRDGFLERRYQRATPHVTVLYNVPRLAVEPAETLVEHLRPKYQNALLVTYVGGIHEDKGTDRLIECIGCVRARVPTARLLLMGYLVEPEPWLTVARKNPDSVEIIPALPYEQMLAYLQVSRVGLAPYPPTWQYPLVSRGNGRKFFSYMQAGVPIVGPAFGEIGQVVRDERCGLLVDTTDPQRMSDAIVELLSRPEWAAEMGARGRRAVVERYNWEKEQRKLIDAYAAIGASSDLCERSSAQLSHEPRATAASAGSKAATVQREW